MVRYSICMLCSNNKDRLEQSLESLSKAQAFSQSEIIVVDNLSKDGSQEELQRLYSRGLVARVVEQKCTRGRGRQIALENSRGDYVLSHMDCDDVFEPSGLDSLIRIYHEGYEGLMMMTKKLKGGSSNITISPRQLLLSLGGWRDINWMEDWDIWARAAEAGKYVNLPYPVANPPHKFIRVRWNERSTSLTKKLIARYGKYRDSYRIGRQPFTAAEHVAVSQKMIYALAKMVVRIKRSALTPVADPLFREIQ